MSSGLHHINSSPTVFFSKLRFRVLKDPTTSILWYMVIKSSPPHYLEKYVYPSTCIIFSEQILIIKIHVTSDNNLERYISWPLNNLIDLKYVYYDISLLILCVQIIYNIIYMYIEILAKTASSFCRDFLYIGCYIYVNHLHFGCKIKSNFIN